MIHFNDRLIVQAVMSDWFQELLMCGRKRLVHGRAWCVVLFRVAIAFLAVWHEPDPSCAAETVSPVIPGYNRFYTGETADSIAGGQLLLSELHCRACHQLEDSGATAAVSVRQSPILTHVGSRIRPEFLRAFLADPQAVKPGTLMPAMFHGVAGNEKPEMIEAVVHFLASTGRFLPTPPSRAAVKRGDDLYHRIGCVACHGPVGRTTEFTKWTVPLGNPAEKYSLASLAEFLLKPHVTRPSGRMPSFGLTPEEARDLASFFLRDIDVPANVQYAYFEGSWENLPDFDDLQPKLTGLAVGFDLAVAQRRNQFAIRFEGYLHLPVDGEYEFLLGSDDGSRLTIDSADVVTNDGVHPHSVQQAKVQLTAGPHQLTLDYFEAGGEESLQLELIGPDGNRVLADGRMSLNVDLPDAGEESFAIDDELVQRGREIFTRTGCASCHELNIDGAVVAPLPAPQPIPVSSVETGCLAASPRGVPFFGLDDRQRASIRSVLGRPSKSADGTADAENSADARGVVTETMTILNCFACHQRGDAGGVDRSVDALFSTTIPEMGDEGRIPPGLDGVGDKLNADWLTHIMLSGAKDRPYMHARMPQFTWKDPQQFVKALVQTDEKNLTEPVTLLEPEHRMQSAGRLMAGDLGLSCIKCHNFGKHRATGIQALDLTTMHRRLRADWFARYMINPQTYRPGTRMPSAWPNGRTVVPHILEGRTDQQLAALWLYLADGEQAAIPAGLIAGQIELKPVDRPVIYRNFLDGLSPRGIAVGFPERAHFAFDAELCAPRLIWHGAFIDASLHWTGRGQGSQRPLGDHIMQLAARTPLAHLATTEAPWPDGVPREAGYQFHGYRLDSSGRPTFRYSYNTIQVEDRTIAVSAEPDAIIERVVTLTADQPDSDIWFYVATGATIEQIDVGVFRVDDALEIDVDAGSSAVLRRAAGQSEVILPVNFVNGTAKIRQRMRW